MSAWHELTLCLGFNCGLCLRDNVLVSHSLIMCRVVTRRDKHPLRWKACILGKTYVSNGESLRKCHKAHDDYGETSKSSLPTAHTWILNKAVYQRLSNELNYKTKIFCFAMTVFIHGICICEGVSEGSGYWHDI